MYSKVKSFVAVVAFSVATYVPRTSLLHFLATINSKRLLMTASLHLNVYSQGTFTLHAWSQHELNDCGLFSGIWPTRGDYGMGRVW